MVSGRFARHDPVDRGPVLLSCHGSRQTAPIWDLPDPSGTPWLFDLLPGQNGDQAAEVDAEAIQEALFTAVR